MSFAHVSHAEIAAFCEERVNLPRDTANEYRKQARGVREKVETHLADHPDFTLKKMLLSGSLAKGTALRSLNDIDMACYVSGAEVPGDPGALANYLAEKLRKAFHQMDPSQIQPQHYSVKISFKTSGLDVDVVPILYRGDPDWYGDLVSQEDGSLLETCIPRHLEFIRKRKDAHPDDFAQVVRLAKFWAGRMKQERDGFRFKSFMIELILAKLADQGVNFTDYVDALQAFFTYIITSNLAERIAFKDYYAASQIPAFTDPLKIIDPVNGKNNVSCLYTTAERDLIVDAAMDAGDAIDSALYAPTKQETVRYWQKVLGSTFSP